MQLIVGFGSDGDFFTMTYIYVIGIEETLTSIIPMTYIYVMNFLLMESMPYLNISCLPLLQNVSHVYFRALLVFEQDEFHIS